MNSARRNYHQLQLFIVFIVGLQPGPRQATVDDLSVEYHAGAAFAAASSFQSGNSSRNTSSRRVIERLNRVMSVINCATNGLLHSC
jgi:hypothetical protein